MELSTTQKNFTILKHIEILEKYQSVDSVNISVFAQEFGLDEKKTIAAISNLIYYGYVSRITIDYADKKLIYLDSSSLPIVKSFL